MAEQAEVGRSPPLVLDQIGGDSLKELRNIKYEQHRTGLLSKRNKPSLVPVICFVAGFHIMIIQVAKSKEYA